MLCFWCFLLTPEPAACARTLEVGQGRPYATIRSALTAAHPGDTVRVHPGVYAEGNLLIDKPITLVGIGRPTLDGQHEHEVITVQAANVCISGFRIAHTGIRHTIDLAGVKVLASDSVTVADNYFFDCNFAVYLSNSNNSTVQNNYIEGSPKEEMNTGNGIHLWKCARAVVEDNTVRHQRDGIYFEFVTDSDIRNNTSEDNIRYGLHFMFSHNDRYAGNHFNRNNAGVAVMYSKQVYMEDNDFGLNWGEAAYGLLLKDISDSEVIRNRFGRNTAAVYMEGSSRIAFSENIFADNGWALRVQASCMDVSFRRNVFTGNTFDVSTNGHVTLNRFEENYWDKYEGYDLNRDGVGDVPFRPVSLYAMVVERMPAGILLIRSFMVYLLDKAEKVIPAITPEGLVDNTPRMQIPQ